MTWNDLVEEAKNDLASASSAGADEQTFGLSSHVKGPEQKALRDKYWKSALAGRIGSYLPGMLVGEGEAALGVNAAKRLAPGALESLLNIGRKGIQYSPQSLLTKGAERLVNMIPRLAEKQGEKILPGMLRAGVRAGITAPAVGQANALIRSGVSKIPGETGEIESGPSLENAGWQSLAGFGTGPLAHLLKKAAPAVYQHPALLNPDNLDKSKEAADEMMNRGVWGGLNSTFKPYATGLKQVLEDVKDQLIPKAQQHEQNKAWTIHQSMQGIPGYPRNAAPPRGLVPVRRLQDSGENIIRESLASGAGEDAATREAFGKATTNLNPDQYGLTTIGDLDNNAKLINTDIKKDFSTSDKSKGFGALDGSLSAKKNRLLDLKSAHDDAMERSLGEHLNPDELKQLADAKGTYGQGRNLEDNIKNFESGEAGHSPNWGHAHTPERFSSKVANKTIMSPSSRTGLGVLLNMFSGEGGGAMAGRLADLKERRGLNNHAATQDKSVDDYLNQYQRGPSQPPKPSESSDNDFMQDMPAAPNNSAGEDQIDPEARAASAAKLKMPDHLVEAAHNPNTRDPKALKWAEDFDKKQKAKTAGPQSLPDDTENEFLQDIPK